MSNVTKLTASISSCGAVKSKLCLTAMDSLDTLPAPLQSHPRRSPLRKQSPLTPSTRLISNRISSYIVPYRVLYPSTSSLSSLRHRRLQRSGRNCPLLMRNELVATYNSFDSRSSNGRKVQIHRRVPARIHHSV